MNTAINARQEIVVSAQNTEFGTVRTFIEEYFSKGKMDEIRIAELILLVEEIFVRAIEQIDNEYEDVIVAIHKKVNEVYVEVSYDGPRFIVNAEITSEFDLGAKIIKRYEEKIGVNYRRGHNVVTVLADRMYGGLMLANVIASLVGLIVGVYLYYIAGDNTVTIITAVLDSLLSAFCTAIIMISAPVTFFSFVGNITNTVVLADRRLKLKNLVSGIALSSIIALVVGAVYAVSLGNALSLKNEVDMVVVNAGEELLKQVEHVLPTDIFSAFTSASPFPLIVLAVITAVAISSMNSRFDEVKSLNDTITSLFCQILKVIYYFLPFIVFVSTAEIIEWGGIHGIITVLEAFVVCLVGMLIMVVVNCLRLKRHGIKCIQFMKDCIPALKESYDINSPIDAIPYNSRFCNKYLGIKMQYAESAMSMVSHLNLDGNCFLLALISVGIFNMLNFTNFTTSVITVIGLMIIILGLSIGAPNQPGSLLIGLIVSLSFLGDATELFGFMVLVEAYIGRILSIINTMGNLTTVMIEATVTGELKNVHN